MQPSTHPTGATTEPRSLRPYQFIATPAITLVLDAIAARLAAGESFAPGVRTLARWANLKSAGQISPILYQLAADGWIAYDSAGTITLLVHPDHSPDRPDQNTDRSPDPCSDREGDHVSDHPTPIRPQIGTTERVVVRSGYMQRADPGADRIRRRMVHEIHEQQQSQDTAAAQKLGPRASRSASAADVTGPAADALAALGADAAIIADALTACPDLTPQQVAATWSWHAARRARSGGRLGVGVFFHAIRRGQIHVPPDQGGTIDVDSYTSGAYGDLFRRGGDVSDLDPVPYDASPARPSSMADHHRDPDQH